MVYEETGKQAVGSVKTVQIGHYSDYGEKLVQQFKDKYKS